MHRRCQNLANMFVNAQFDLLRSREERQDKVWRVVDSGWVVCLQL